MRIFAQFFQREASAAIRPVAQAEVELGFGVFEGRRGGGIVGFTSFETLAQSFKNLPIIASLRAFIEQRLGVAAGIADGQSVEAHVVVSRFEARSGWQNVVGVARSFVEVNINRHHEIEAGQGRFQLRAVGRREHGVAAARDQGPQLARAGREHFLGQTSYRQLTHELRSLAHAAAVPVILIVEAGLAQNIQRGRGKHVAARLVQMAGQQVQGIYQPQAQPAKLLHRHPYPAVNHGPLGGGQFPRQRSNHLSVKARNGAGQRWRELRHGHTQLREAIREFGQPAGLHQVFGVEYLGHGQ